MLRGLLSFCRNLLRKTSVEADLHEEINSTVEILTEEKMRENLPRPEARRRALLELGGPEQVKERIREARAGTMVEQWLQDIRHGFRTLGRSPGFTVVAVATLALGIGINTAVFTIVNGVLLRPMPFPQPERLFLVAYTPQNGPFDNGPCLLDRDYLEFRREDRVFEQIASFAGGSANLSGAGDPANIPAARVTPDFFTVLRVNPSIGRDFLAGEDQPGHDHVALISDSLWRNRLAADPSALGKVIKLDGDDYSIIGIMPIGFRFPSNAEVWRPLATRIDPHASMMRPVIGRLKAGVPPRAAQAELDAFTRRFPSIPGEDRTAWRARILPVKEMLVEKIRPSLLVFTVAVGFVLLIACANVGNLMLARAAGRQPEIALRIALGAGRWRLVRQLFTESLLVSFAGGTAGVLLALWGVQPLLSLAPDGTIPRTEMIRMDGWVLAFTMCMSLATGMIFGLVPAFQTAGRGLREAVNRGGRTFTGRHESLRGALVIAEIALALVLLAGAGLMLRSFLRLRAVDPGFRAENVLTATVDLPDSIYRTASQMQAFHEQALSNLSVMPGVLAAGAVNWEPLGGNLVKGDFQIEGGRQLPSGYMVDKPCVSPGYVSAMGIRLLSGRDFTERDDASAPGVVIISRSVARDLWPGEDPIGKRISMEEHPKSKDWLTIIGVVDDVKQMSLSLKSDAAMYQPYRQVARPFFLSHMTFVVHTAYDPQTIASAMRAAFRKVDKNLPVQSIVTMQGLIAETTAEPRFRTRVLGLFAVLALSLALVGIYGVMAYTVVQRRHEIGIRMALGARSGDVLGMILRRTLLLAVAGIAIGSAGALALTRVLAKFLFEVSPGDPSTFVAVALLLCSAALGAALIPARRATRIDPMLTLRYE
ncbi:MAG TPA: ABC transporter permease [Acidobacteriota bacterium]|nr:ABC transporter permease [Acidobacteriota bacterium]